MMNNEICEGIDNAQNESEKWIVLDTSFIVRGRMNNSQKALSSAKELCRDTGRKYYVAELKNICKASERPVIVEEL